MRIVLAPDSYKGSATAIEVCDAMKEGILNVKCDSEIVVSPMADGGEGTVENLTSAYNGDLIEVVVSDPIGRPVTAKYGILQNNLCIIEMAQSSGIMLLEDSEMDPMVTTTYGLGQIIVDAMNRGCRTFVIGLGGSATNDGGCGMAAALGYEFLDSNGQPIGPGGGQLGKINEIRTDKVDKRLKKCDFRIACDVTNPLCGLNGASYIFGPQKGATPEKVKTLDANLRHFADIIKRDLGVDVADIPGAGAAGGLGAGATAFLSGQLLRGVAIISELLKLEEKISKADVVFTGEGKFDTQTLEGKAPFGVVSIANRVGVPSIIIAGDVASEMKTSMLKGVREVIGIRDEGMTVEFAKEHVHELIVKATQKAYKRFIDYQNL